MTRDDAYASGSARSADRRATIPYMGKLRLDKRDVARRQLEAAVELYFRDGEPVAIHALAGGAHEVLGDLLKAAQIEDELLTVIRPERRAEFLRMWRNPQNFFKHADRDAQDVLVYETALAEHALFDAVRRFRVVNDPTPPMKVFEFHYLLGHADFIRNSITRLAFEYPPAWMRRISRGEFYDVMLPVASG